MSKGHEKLVINQLNDEKSFKLIFDSYFVSVYKRIFNIINNHVEAEEITQDIFIAMWNRRKQLNDIDNWKAYLIKAATFKAIDHLRKRKDFIEYTDKTEFSNAVVEEADYADKEAILNTLRGQIDLLPERCQLVFKLSRFEGQSHAEIAKTLDISQSTVENQIGKALKILRKNLLPQLFFGLLQFFH